MEAVVQVAGLGIITAILCTVVKDHHKVLAILLSLAASFVALSYCISFIDPIVNTVDQLRELANLDLALTAPLLKAVGIGLLTQTAVGVCQDTDEKTLGKIVEFSGAVLTIYVTLPLLSTVLELLEQMLRE